MSAPIVVEVRPGAAAAQAATALAGAFDRTLIRVGIAGTALPSLARNVQAALVIISVPGRGRIAGVRAAARASALSAAASCPVLVVPDGFRADALRPGDGGSIVIGVDGSPESLRAWDLARALAGPLDLKPLPVFADQERPVPHGLGGIEAEPAGARKSINSVVAREGGRLIVVGSRDRGPIAGLLRGSVSAALAGSARVPVLIVSRQAQIDALARSPGHVSDPARTATAVRS
jgi:nucleotide-binding universal stress UspA family protein